MAIDFAEQFSIPFPVYIDSDQTTYQFMNFKRRAGLGLKSTSNLARALKKGHIQGAVKGDPWQQGGEAIFAQDGSILWSHAAKTAGSHASRKEILKVLNDVLSER
jgi:hypothetical protein